MESLLVSTLFWSQILDSEGGEIGGRKPEIVISERSASEKVLVLAPHPDDEILCCSTKIAEKLAQNAEVKIVFLTDGEAIAGSAEKSKNYARTRRAESVAAAKKLGISPQNLVFLGFPDAYLDTMTSEKTTSDFSGFDQTQFFHSPPQTPFTRENLKGKLEQIFRDFAPDLAFWPSPKDAHPDHQVAGKIGAEIVAQMSEPPEVLQYVVHSQKNDPASNSGFQNPWKRDLIDVFQSQFHDDRHRNFLYSFSQKPEVFEPFLLE